MCSLPKLRAGIELQGTYTFFNALEYVLWSNVGVKWCFRPGCRTCPAHIRIHTFLKSLQESLTYTINVYRSSSNVKCLF